MEPFKPSTNVAVADVPAERERSGNEDLQPSGRFSRWPIFLAIFCIFGLSVASAMVVYFSDGKPTGSWKARPSVLLAIIAPMITLSYAYLLSTALSIAWWRAAEVGTTIAHLDRIWDRAFWLRKSTWKTAVFSTHGFKRIAAVSLLVPIGNFLYNPLFQLSTSASRTGDETSTVSLTLDILPEIPEGLAALAYTGMQARMDFSAAAAQWYLKDPIRTKDQEGYRCAGTCRGTVVAPGITASCTNTTENYNFTMRADTDRWLFEVNQTYTRSPDNYMLHTLRSKYTPDMSPDCIATVITETCNIEIGQVEYQVVISGTNVTVLPRPWYEWTSTNVSHTEPHDAPTPTRRPGPLWALGFMTTYFGAVAGWLANENILTSGGILAEQLFVYTAKEDDRAYCDFNYKWSSPTEYVLNGLGETLFRLAMNGNSVTNLTVLSAPNGIFPPPQRFDAVRTRAVVFYQSEYKWLGAALGVALLSLAVLVTVLGGAARLERDVSMSPIETFQVFPHVVPARLARSGTIGVGAVDVLKHMGESRVEFRTGYGAVAMRES